MQTPRTCEQCGTIFTPAGTGTKEAGRRFCSRFCSNQRHRRPAVRPPRVCERCGAEFIPQGARGRFCSRNCSHPSNRPGTGTGRSTHPLYPRWIGMWNRCTNPGNAAWPDYGGRGISVHPRWSDFDQYVHDVGLPPDSTPRWSLDREDNDGNYEPGNVRWVTHTVQMNNTRRSRVTPNLPEIRRRLVAGQPLQQISRDLGFDDSTVYAALRRRPDLFDDLPAFHALKANSYHSIVLPHLDYILAELAAGRSAKSLCLELGFEASTISAFRKRNPHLFA